MLGRKVVVVVRLLVAAPHEDGVVAEPDCHMPGAAVDLGTMLWSEHEKKLDIRIGQIALAVRSSGNVSACHRGDWIYGSWDRIPPGYRMVVKKILTMLKLGTAVCKQHLNHNISLLWPCQNISENMVQTPNLKWIQLNVIKMLLFLNIHRGCWCNLSSGGLFSVK
jgi:hypothetical protein